MRGWIEGMQKSIDFMEQNLTEDLEIEAIARIAALSPFYYQRIFGALCGMTVGVKRRFHTDTSYQEIPKFWDEWMAQGEKRPIMGTFGVCLDMDGTYFDYWIADLYFPWEEIPAGCETRVIPAGVWAQFPCTIGTLQETNTKIWSQWLLALQGYSLAGEYDVEVYLPPMNGEKEMRVAIWVPLKKD